MIQAASRVQMPYLRSNNFWRSWSDAQCEICEIEGVRLSYDRAPPRLVHAAPKPAPARVEKEVPARKKKSEDPYENLLNVALHAADAVSTFQKWLRSPSAAAPAKVPPAPKLNTAPVEKVPPFDLQDVPKAMRKLGMPVGAALQDRWFAGEANYSLTPDELNTEINQDGKPYAPAMVDLTTIKMDWVLKFPRARKVCDVLIEELLTTPRALEALRLKLTPYRDRSHISTWLHANEEFLDFHQKFHFQHIAVDAGLDSVTQQLRRNVTAGGIPDDLTAALGSFNLYVAARSVWFDDAGRCAYVEEVSVYVRDPFEFSGEQYLGHWSADHIAAVPDGQVNGGWIDSPVIDRNLSTGKLHVLYPVSNRSYRDWRTKHGRGGDFMIYSDRHTVKLDSPIRVEL